MAQQENSTEAAEEAIAALRMLSPIQIEVLGSIITKFAEEQKSQLERTDFLTPDAFEYFSVRLAVHHASSNVPLKKENFEHILEHSFLRAGHRAKLSESMTHRGADLEVDDVFFSLKTEASKGLNPKSITVSKLMEAKWIRDLNGPEDVPAQIQSMIMPHFQNYERIFTLRSYSAPKDENLIRYDLRQIPKDVLERIGDLIPGDFSPLTGTNTTSAQVKINGKRAFTLRLDGSVEKITISNLDVELCPLHAWWILSRPG